jgi:hypothetical protein
MRSHSFGVAIAAFCAATLVSGCAIRYDKAGVSRVGIGLWGFGDPPGVHWNLDWPRQPVPELPAAPRRELPPASPPRDLELPPSRHTAEGAAASIDDNPGCAAPRFASAATPDCRTARADLRIDESVRR